MSDDFYKDDSSELESGQAQIQAIISFLNGNGRSRIAVSKLYEAIDDENVLAWRSEERGGDYHGSNTIFLPALLKSLIFWIAYSEC